MYPIPIVPTPHLEDLSGGREYYLALSHLMPDEKYRRFLKLRAFEGARIILDNSAHENGQGESIQTLLEQAQLLGATEVVLPDELFSAYGTVARTISALMQIRRLRKEKSFSYMIVPQGQTRDELHFCLSMLLEASRLLLKVPVTIGISKDYHSFKGVGEGVYRELVQSAIDAVGPSRVHLLGWPKPIRCLKTLSQSFAEVRSTDSARAIVYALAGIDLSKEHNPEYPGRPNKFFDLKMTTSQIDLALRNLGVYYLLSQGGDPG